MARPQLAGNLALTFLKPLDLPLAFLTLFKLPLSLTFAVDMDDSQKDGQSHQGEDDVSHDPTKGIGLCFHLNKVIVLPLSSKKLT